MIKITYAKTKKGIKHLVVIGHANSNDYGKDVICAGVSAIVIGGANALKVSKKSKIKIEEGYAEIKLDPNEVEKNKQKFEVILIQLKSIAESYPKKVKIIRE